MKCMRATGLPRWWLQSTKPSNGKKAIYRIRDAAPAGSVLRAVNSAFADFGCQTACQGLGLTRILVAGLFVVGDGNRRRELLEGERADAHAGIQRHGHDAEIAQLERCLSAPTWIESACRAVHNNAD